MTFAVSTAAEPTQKETKHEENEHKTVFNGSNYLSLKEDKRLFFVYGSSSVMDFYEETFRRATGENIVVCVPYDTTILIRKNVFEDYLLTHPKELSEDATLLFLKSLVNKFPCKEAAKTQETPSSVQKNL